MGYFWNQTVNAKGKSCLTNLITVSDEITRFVDESPLLGFFLFYYSHKFTCYSELEGTQKDC